MFWSTKSLRVHAKFVKQFKSLELWCRLFGNLFDGSHSFQWESVLSVKYLLAEKLLRYLSQMLSLAFVMISIQFDSFDKFSIFVFACAFAGVSWFLSSKQYLCLYIRTIPWICFINRVMYNLFHNGKFTYIKCKHISVAKCLACMRMRTQVYEVCVWKSNWRMNQNSTFVTPHKNDFCRK